MPFLWLGVDDAPGPGSQRTLIERNAIALLSGDAESALDPPSPGWLGLHSDREPVRRSGVASQEVVSQAGRRSPQGIYNPTMPPCRWR